MPATSERGAFGAGLLCAWPFCVWPYVAWGMARAASNSAGANRIVAEMDLNDIGVHQGLRSFRYLTIRRLTSSASNGPCDLYRTSPVGSISIVNGNAPFQPGSKASIILYLSVSPKSRFLVEAC